MKQNGWRTGRIQRTHTLDAYTAGIAADLGSRALIGGRFYPYITATCAAIHRSTTRSRLADHDDVRRTHMLSRPGRSVREERANFTRLVLGCIEAKFCNKICVGIAICFESSRRDLHNALLCTVLERSQSSNFCSKIAENFANFFAKFC